MKFIWLALCKFLEKQEEKDGIFEGDVINEIMNTTNNKIEENIIKEEQIIMDSKETSLVETTKEEVKTNNINSVSNVELIQNVKIKAEKVNVGKTTIIYHIFNKGKEQTLDIIGTSKCNSKEEAMSYLRTATGNFVETNDGFILADTVESIELQHEDYIIEE